MSVAEQQNSELAALTTDELENEIAELASHIYAGTCRWLELVAELDTRGAWTESGCGSCAEWIAWRCGLMPRAAREHVRVARRLAELPLIHDAFSRGKLSYAKVRALTRVADDETEEELLELARHLTAAQLDRAVRAYGRVTTADANVQHAAAYAGYYWDDDGSLVLHARLAPEDGALFLRALEATRDSLWERKREADRGPAETRSSGSPATGRRRGWRHADRGARVGFGRHLHGDRPCRGDGRRVGAAVHAEPQDVAADEP